MLTLTSTSSTVLKKIALENYALPRLMHPRVRRVSSLYAPLTKSASTTPGYSASRALDVASTDQTNAQRAFKQDLSVAHEHIGALWLSARIKYPTGRFKARKDYRPKTDRPPPPASRV